MTNDELKRLLYEASALASSYAHLSEVDPYAGRDPKTHEPRDPDLAKDLERRLVEAAKSLVDRRE